jgi:hypothetical protein
MTFQKEEEVNTFGGGGLSWLSLSECLRKEKKKENSGQTDYCEIKGEKKIVSKDTLPTTM